jgi:hypothetical protein
LLGTIYNILLILFATAVASSAPVRSRRITGVSLAGIGVAGVASAFFPIHMRGQAWTINETMHVTLTVVTVVLIVVAMSSSATAAGRRFFAYSIISMAVMLLFGALTGSAGAAMAEDLPTPWIGIAERISIFTFLAWIATFAAVLMRTAPSQPSVAAGHQLHLRGHHASR